MSWRTTAKTGWSCVLLLAMSLGTAKAEVCRTQSQMTAAERDGLVAAATSLAKQVQASDTAGVRALTIAEYQQNFDGINNAIVTASPKLQGATLTVDSVYALDGTNLKDASSLALFYCPLGKTAMETDFQIPGLPPGMYGFAMVKSGGAEPWMLSFLLRQESGAWKLAGFFPKAMTAGGHDGLWYWTTARALREKRPWSSWLYYQEAVNLLQPVGFITSTHMEKLQSEQTAATPPALSGGISNDAPLVVKSKTGTEFRFTGLALDDSLDKGRLDLVAHLRVDKNGDPEADRKRNIEAMVALLQAHPELRQDFHGVWVFAEVPGQSTVVPTELAMGDIPS